MASLFGGIGCDVAYWTRQRRSEDQARGAAWLPLPELAARSDVLVVNVSLASETRGLIDAALLAELPRGAIVVDASRGGVVDHVALLGAIEAGSLRGAAIDVFEHEPLPDDSAAPPVGSDPAVQPRRGNDWPGDGPHLCPRQRQRPAGGRG